MLTKNSFVNSVVSLVNEGHEDKVVMAWIRQYLYDDKHVVRADRATFLAEANKATGKNFTQTGIKKISGAEIKGYPLTERLQTTASWGNGNNLPLDAKGKVTVKTPSGESPDELQARVVSFLTKEELDNAVEVLSGPFGPSVTRIIHSLKGYTVEQVKTEVEYALQEAVAQNNLPVFTPEVEAMNVYTQAVLAGVVVTREEVEEHLKSLGVEVKSPEFKLVGKNYDAEPDNKDIGEINMSTESVNNQIQEAAVNAATKAADAVKANADKAAEAADKAAAAVKAQVTETALTPEEEAIIQEMQRQIETEGGDSGYFSLTGEDNSINSGYIAAACAVVGGGIEMFASDKGVTITSAVGAAVGVAGAFVAGKVVDKHIEGAVGRYALAGTIGVFAGGLGARVGRYAGEYFGVEPNAENPMPTSIVINNAPSMGDISDSL